MIRIRTNVKGRSLVLRTAEISDVKEILRLDNRVWTKYPARFDQIHARLVNFLEGNFIAMLDGKIVGYLSIFFFHYDIENPFELSWEQITGGGTNGTHDLSGEWMFGTALTIDPDVQNLGIGTRLEVLGWHLLLKYNKRGCLLGARMPGYHENSEMSVQEYVKSNLDPQLRLYRRMGFKVVKVVPNYMHDPDSLNYGVLMKIDNPFFCLPSVLRRMIGWMMARYGYYVFKLLNL